MIGDKPQNLAVELSLLVLLATLWGSSYLFIKVAVETIPPLTLIAIRVSVAALFLMVVLTVRGEKLPRDGKSWRMLLIQAFFNSIGAWTILAWGQQYVDSGLATVLNSTSPLFVFFITLFITRHEPLGPLKIIGASLGVLGVVLIVGTEAMSGIGQAAFAQLAILFSALLYAGAAIYGKRFSYLSPVVTATAVMIWASIWLIPLALIADRPWTLTPSITSLAAAIALSIFCTGVALLLYYRLVQTLGSLGVTSQGYLRIGVGVLLGVVVLGEQITVEIGIGLSVIILGVMAINFPKKKPRVI